MGLVYDIRVPERWWTSRDAFEMNLKLMSLEPSGDINERLQSTPECSGAPYMMLLWLLQDLEQNLGSGAKGYFTDVLHQDGTRLV